MVHSLTMTCAHYCIQKSRHPKLLKIPATHVPILGTRVLPAGFISNCIKVHQKEN